MPRAAHLLALALLASGCRSARAHKAQATRWIVDGDQREPAELGDAAPPPSCLTVWTEEGRCIPAGRYDGDPILLLGHRPFVRGQVDIDMHGATATASLCDAGICIHDLPTNGPTPTTIIVQADPGAR